MVGFADNVQLAESRLIGWLLIAAATGLDYLIGDPRWCLHPVQVMDGSSWAQMDHKKPSAVKAPWTCAWVAG